MLVVWYYITTCKITGHRHSALSLSHPLYQHLWTFLNSLITPVVDWLLTIFTKPMVGAEPNRKINQYKEPVRYSLIAYHTADSIIRYQDIIKTTWAVVTFTY